MLGQAVDGTPADVGPGIGVGAGRKKRAQDRWAGPRGIQQWGEAAVAAGVDGGTRGQQPLNDVGVVEYRGGMQRRPTGLVGLVGLGMFEQPINDTKISQRRRAHQRRNLVQQFRVRLHRRNLAPESCRHRRPARGSIAVRSRVSGSVP